MHDKRPSKPAHLSPYVEICLRALADQGLGDVISVSGGVGLLHYLDYRTTHDVDAWWSASVTETERTGVLQRLETTLGAFGQVRTRAWGDVVSIELSVEGRVVFSFQIARRSAQLAPLVKVPWVDVGLDSFSDLVAGKMVALVERGAPRDFRDIHAVCQAGFVTPEACWDLWSQRQVLAGSDSDASRAKLAVETHLVRIEQHRPLAQIGDVQAREQAMLVRVWFREVFLDVLVVD